MDFVSVLVGGIIAPILLWGYVIALSVLKIQFHRSKRAKAKVFEEYPYYQMPWYKKIFFLGLKDAVPKSFIVFAYIYHLTTILHIGIHVACLVMLQSILLSILSKISGFIWGLFQVIFMIIVYNTEIDTKKRK